jgi:hypothetical protein
MYKYVKLSKSSSSNKLEENIYDNDQLIIPAPINFREKAVVHIY